MTEKLFQNSNVNFGVYGLKTLLGGQENVLCYHLYIQHVDTFFKNVYIPLLS